jgi:hypothetical protein
MFMRATSILFSVLVVLSLIAPAAYGQPAAPQACAGLFVSEYLEGSSNNKALEIYNGTGAAVHLAAEGYRVEFYFNGSAAAGTIIPLTGAVASGDVYVLAGNDAAAPGAHPVAAGGGGEAVAVQARGTRFRS